MKARDRRRARSSVATPPQSTRRPCGLQGGVGKTLHPASAQRAPEELNNKALSVPIGAVDGFVEDRKICGGSIPDRCIQHVEAISEVLPPLFGIRIEAVNSIAAVQRLLLK